MKKTLFLKLFLTSLLIVVSQVCNAGARHVIEVKRMGHWAPDYLTVTNNYGNALWITAPTSLQFMSVITEINGKSTKDLNEQQFYSILDAATDVDLTYMSKIRGENKTFHDKAKKGVGLGVVWGTEVSDNYYNGSYKTSHYPSEFRGFIASDYDVDFFKFCTFDYAFGDDNDVLEKKQLLRPLTKELESRGMKRVEENPDLFIYVTHDASKNIETVYMPQQVSSTKGGMYGRIINYGNVTTGYANNNSTTVNSETGQMKSFTTTDVYLQVTVLDAKRVDKKSIPKVWQFTFEKRFDKNVDMSFFDKLLETNAQNYPFDGSISYYYGYIYTAKWSHNPGAYALKETGYNENITPISDVVPGGWADQLGVKKGDEVYGATYNDSKFYPINYKGFGGFSEKKGIKIGKKKIKDVKEAPQIEPYKFIYEEYAKKL